MQKAKVSFYCDKCHKPQIFDCYEAKHGHWICIIARNRDTDWTGICSCYLGIEPLAKLEIDAGNFLEETANLWDELDYFDFYDEINRE